MRLVRHVTEKLNGFLANQGEEVVLVLNSPEALSHADCLTGRSRTRLPYAMRKGL